MWVVMFILLAFALSIHWNFEGGSLQRIEQLGPNHYRCHVKGQTDQDGRNRQASWYYFRVDGARNQNLTFEMVDLAGEYNYQPTRGSITKDTLPFYSSDQVTWHPVEEGTYDPAIPKLQFEIKAPADRFWIGHVPPYTTVNFRELLHAVSSSSYVRVTSVGKSVEGREISLVTITDSAVPDNAKKVIWLMFRQHAW